MQRTATKRSIADVKDVPHYGERFPFIPWSWSARIKVSTLFAKHLYQKVGLWPFIQFWLVLPIRIPSALRKHREGLTLMKQSYSSLAKFQWLLLIIIYEDLEKRFNKAEAYAYAKAAIQDGSKIIMNELYQADTLAQFEDPYLAFWEYHKAMFTGDDNFPNELIEAEGVKKMIVHDCRNCAIAKMTIPELAPLGCDHDITGFQAIADKVEMDFRRPTTLAKDGKPCEFMFFRKGMAPEGLETK